VGAQHLIATLASTTFCRASFNFIPYLMRKLKLPTYFGKWLEVHFYSLLIKYMLLEILHAAHHSSSYEEAGTQLFLVVDLAGPMTIFFCLTVLSDLVWSGNLVLALTRTAILGFRPHSTYDHIFQSHDSGVVQFG
jgi:hypothetical protein